jgi:uncharacterized protein with GYD domain
MQRSMYMYQARYTPEAVASLIEHPQDRVEQVRKAFQEMGADIVVGGYPIGEYDVLVIFTAPDETTAAALALAIAAGGATESAMTTRLLTSEEWIESLSKAQRSRYRPMVAGRRRRALMRRLR